MNKRLKLAAICNTTFCPFIHSIEFLGNSLLPWFDSWFSFCLFIYFFLPLKEAAQYIWHDREVCERWSSYTASRVDVMGDSFKAAVLYNSKVRTPLAHFHCSDLLPRFHTRTASVSPCFRSRLGSVAFFSLFFFQHLRIFSLHFNLESGVYFSAASTHWSQRENRWSHVSQELSG